jgi:hypothetical protein
MTKPDTFLVGNIKFSNAEPCHDWGTDPRVLSNFRLVPSARELREVFKKLGIFQSGFEKIAFFL